MLILFLKEFFEDYKSKSGIGFWMYVCMNTGFNLMMEIDTQGKSWADIFQVLVKEWIDKNPEKVFKIATELVHTIQEHFEEFQWIGRP